MLDINEIVRVSATISPSGALRREFGRSLFVTVDQTLTPQERTRTYPSQTAIEADFATNSQPYAAGAIYFQQNPFPKNMIVGRYIDSVQLAVVFGGLLTSTLADFTSITDGSFKFSANPVAGYDVAPTTEYEITGLDFSSATSLTDVGDVIDLALGTAVTGALNSSFAYDPPDGRFEMNFEALTDPDMTIVGLSSLSAAASGTDISSLLLMGADEVSRVAYSTVAETIEEAMAAIEASDPSFYFVTTDTTVSDTTDSDDLSAWVASRSYLYSADSSDLAVLSENDSVFNRLSALAPPRTFGTWSKTEDYKGLSAAGRMSSVNFNASNSLITLKFKELPGTLPDLDITPTNAQALQNQYVNFYSERSGVPMYEEGYTFKPGTWVDVRYWLDWFVDAVRVEVFNLLYASGKVPQTEVGMTAVKQAITLVCDQGVNNGGIAGGQLSPALTLDVQQSTGNTAFDGELSSGYLVYADPVATLSQSDRDQRKVPPFKVWLKGSGAIHFVDVIVTFEN